MMVEGRGGNRSGGRGQAQERKRSWLPSTTLLFFSSTRSIVDLLLPSLLFLPFVFPFKLDLSFEILKEDPPPSQLSIKKTYNDR